MKTDKQPTVIPFDVMAMIAWLVTGWAMASMTVLTLLESADRSVLFISPATWQRIVQGFGGRIRLVDGSSFTADIPFGSVAAVLAGVLMTAWWGSAIIVRIFSTGRIRDLATSAGSNTGRAALLIGAWFAVWLATNLLGWERAVGFTEAITEMWIGISVAIWVMGTVILCGTSVTPREDTSRIADRRNLYGVIAAVACYTLIYTTINWQMYWGLLIPHGDSAMYEEHLWNLLHGKGFRSYLDQGLFLGEHIQILHLALIPLYVFWPSHLLLEFCESLALGCTAIPVYWIAHRHTGSSRAAAWMAVATLFYFPLHYLDIAIDFKTFRPMALTVPILTCAIDQMERGRLKTMVFLLIVALTGKEDLAIVIAPLGVWMAFHGWHLYRHGEVHTSTIPARRWMICGVVLAAATTLYLLLTVKVFIPWFRGGETVHYARYFSRFGETPTEIATNMLTRPGLLFRELITAGTTVYALRVVGPLGGTPLLSPSRLLVGAPLFVLLCLNELAQQTPAPVHHFHAPLVPIVLWAAAAGLPNWRHIIRRPEFNLLHVAQFACLCALFTGAFMSFHPLTVQFWDPGRATCWRILLVPGERATQFSRVEELIPMDARVASTDFVHPRFTHRERSYDYSDYLRKVAGYEHGVPEDTDYIVIDTQHPYSTIKRPEDVRELREHPDQWEFLSDVWEQTSGYFIVLKRK